MIRGLLNVAPNGQPRLVERPRKPSWPSGALKQQSSQLVTKLDQRRSAKIEMLLPTNLKDLQTVMTSSRNNARKPRNFERHLKELSARFKTVSMRA